MNAQELKRSVLSDEDEDLFLYDVGNLKGEILKTHSQISFIREGMANIRKNLLYLKNQHASIETKIQMLENKHNSSLENTVCLEDNDIKSGDISNNVQPDIVPKVSNFEFDDLPRYMRGRLTLKEVNNFVNAYNSVIIKKYGLTNVVEYMKCSGKGKGFSLNKFNSSGVGGGVGGGGGGAGRPFCTAAELRRSGLVRAGEDASRAAAALRCLGRLEHWRARDGRAALALPPPPPGPAPGDGAPRRD